MTQTSFITATFEPIACAAEWRPLRASEVGGVDVDLRNGEMVSCCVELPYPSPSWGTWTISCSNCKSRFGVHATGRVDDPRTVTLPCFAQMVRS